MRRGRYVPDGMIDYRGHTIGLTSDGKFWCRDLNLVADTLDEVKKLIRDTEAKVKALPKIDVYAKVRYGHGDFTKGTATGRAVGYNGRYVWVTWKDERGRTSREQIYAANVYPATEENVSLIGVITTLEQQRTELQEQIDNTTAKLVSIEPLRED